MLILLENGDWCQISKTNDSLNLSKYKIAYRNKIAYKMIKRETTRRYIDNLAALYHHINRSCTVVYVDGIFFIFIFFSLSLFNARNKTKQQQKSSLCETSFEQPCISNQFDCVLEAKLCIKGEHKVSLNKINAQWIKVKF